MEYRRLGRAGIKLSEVSLGSWITFGSRLDLDGVKQCMREAFHMGVNFFDTAEEYANGVAELLLGEALKEYRRSDLVISTKIFWGGEGPNDVGLSWKRIVEGTKNSLRRLQLDYVDLLFCHRPDPNTPIEETVRAMEVLIKGGLVFYWGTSEWSRQEIEEAHQIARELHITPPTMEQPEYNLFHRERVEVEYASLYKQFGMGTTIWSPLDSGLLTGKYNNGIPPGSRLSQHKWLQSLITQDKINKVRKLAEIAREINCTLAQLAIAWCLKNPHVSTVILGASNLDQLKENIKATEVKHDLNAQVMDMINQVINS